MTFAEKLKQTRENKGISQAELARRIGISRAAISRYESGERTQISTPVLMSIAQCLGVHPLYLAGIEDDPEERPVEETMIFRYAVESSDEFRLTMLLKAFAEMNSDGRMEAVKTVMHLVYVPEYTGGELPDWCFNDKDIDKIIKAIDKIGDEKHGPR